MDYLPTIEELHLSFLDSASSLSEAESAKNENVQNGSDDDIADSWSDELTDPNSASPEVDSNLVLFRQVALLYKNHNYMEILTLMPSLNTNIALPPAIHLMLSTSLFRLGRIGGGLREMSLAIELESSSARREKYIRSLVGFFRSIGMQEQACACFNEIIEMAKTTALVNQGSEANGNDTQLATYEASMEQLFMDSPNENMADMAAKSGLVEQAEKYLAANGSIATISFGSDCLAVNSMLTTAKVQLDEWNSSPERTILIDPLSYLLEAYKFHAPLSLFDGIYSDFEKLERFMGGEICKHPEIDYEMDPKKLARKFKAWGIRQDCGIRTLCCLLIKHKVVWGHIEYYKKNYAGAIVHFTWVFKLLKRLERRLLMVVSSTGCLSVETKQTVLLYICHSYCCDEYYSHFKLPYIITQMVSENTIPGNQHGLLSKFFTFCGYTYEKLAFYEAQSVNIEAEGITTTGLKLKQVHLTEMIRKYILAASTRLSDDPSVIWIYDRIIWGILMHGGVHLRTLWFFIVLRNYFFIEFDFGCFQLSSFHDYRQFEDEKILDRYENGWELVDRCKDLCNDLNRVSNQNVWDASAGNTYLIPQIYEQDNKFILLSDFYDDTLDIKSFVYTSRTSIKPKIKSCLKKVTGSPKTYHDNIKVSKEFITLWCESYYETHGNIPSIIEDLA
ncbi:uncharacterized protein RJT20DRAFT_127144 [Scheffersomyces xylosifermentans]|uniref:uncharacterized protein n=1 Tax=Scheffersomyces xylosifermentans TaxID=1304137 RepID=UPI00315C7075